MIWRRFKFVFPVYSWFFMNQIDLSWNENNLTISAGKEQVSNLFSSSATLEISLLFSPETKKVPVEYASLIVTASLPQNLCRKITIKLKPMQKDTVLKEVFTEVAHKVNRSNFVCSHVHRTISLPLRQKWNSFTLQLPSCPHQNSQI